MGGQYPAAASVERAMGNRRSINANQRRAPRQDASAFAGGSYRGRGGNLQQPGAALQRRLAGGVTGAAGATPPAVDLPPTGVMPPPGLKPNLGGEGDRMSPDPNDPRAADFVARLQTAQAGGPGGIGPAPGIGGVAPPPGIGKPMGGPPAYANFGLPPQVMQQLQNLRGVPQLSANPMPPPGAVSTPGQPPPVPVPEQARSLADMYSSFASGRRQM